MNSQKIVPKISKWRVKSGKSFSIPYTKVKEEALSQDFSKYIDLYHLIFLTQKSMDKAKYIKKIFFQKILWLRYSIKYSLEFGALKVLGHPACFWEIYFL